jgi:hypothetical protein
MKRRGWLVVIVIAWTALVMIAYFAVHKPVSPDRALALSRVAALLSSLMIIGWWGIISMAAGGLGRWLTGGWGESPIERIVFSLGAGLGALSGLTLIAGLLGLFSNRLIWMAGLILLAGGLWMGPLRRLASDLREAFPCDWPASRLARIALAFVVLMLTLAFIGALTPPTAWDSLAYHLNGPKLYLEQGRIAHAMDLAYLGFPQLAEMLYTLALIAGLPSVAQLIHWTFAVLIVALLVNVMTRRWNRSTGWLAAAIFMSAPTVVWLASWAYVDLMLTFYSFAAFVALTSPQNAPTQRMIRLAAWRLDLCLVLGGAMCGLAMATKYTVASVAVALAILAFRSEPGSNLRVRITRVAWFSFMAGLVASPWYIKNWLTTGNPFYPFLLNGAFWDAWRAWWYGRWGTGLFFTAPWKLLIAPFEMALMGIEGAQGFGATIGPLLLMLAPLCVLSWRRMADAEAQRRLMTDALVMCGIVYIAWLVQVGGSALLLQTRLLFPIFPPLAMLASAGFDGLGELEWPQFSARRVVGALVTLTLLLTAGGLTWDLAASDRISFLTGAQSRDDFLLAHLGTHYAAMQAVNELPVGSRVLFLWEPRSFYCRVECWPDSLLDRWWHLRRTVGGPIDIAQVWQRQGFTHVLLYRAGYQAIVQAGFDPITAQDQMALSDLLVGQAQLVRQVGDAYSLYSLESR